MHEQLRPVLAELAAIRARFERLLADTPDERWNARARSDAWSVAECIEHLNLTSRAMQPLLERASEEARSLGVSAGRMRRTLLGALLGSMVGPAPGLGNFRFGRTKTPPPFVPSGDRIRIDVVEEFVRHLKVQEEALRAADDLPLHRVKVRSPFVAGAAYDGFSAWIILVRHAQRHLAQAERVWGPR